MTLNAKSCWVKTFSYDAWKAAYLILTASPQDAIHVQSQFKAERLPCLVNCFKFDKKPKEEVRGLYAWVKGIGGQKDAGKHWEKFHMARLTKVLSVKASGPVTKQQLELQRIFGVSENLAEDHGGAVVAMRTGGVRCAEISAKIATAKKTKDHDWAHGLPLLPAPTPLKAEDKLATYGPNIHRATGTCYQCNYNKKLKKIICPAYARRRPAFLIGDESSMHPLEPYLLGAGVNDCLEKYEQTKPTFPHEMTRRCTSFSVLPEGYCCFSMDFRIYKGPRQKGHNWCDIKDLKKGGKLAKAMEKAQDLADQGDKSGHDKAIAKFLCTEKPDPKSVCVPRLPPSKHIPLAHIRDDHFFGSKATMQAFVCDERVMDIGKNEPPAYHAWVVLAGTKLPKPRFLYMAVPDAFKGDGKYKTKEAVAEACAIRDMTLDMDQRHRITDERYALITKAATPVRDMAVPRLFVKFLEEKNKFLLRNVPCMPKVTLDLSDSPEGIKTRKMSRRVWSDFFSRQNRNCATGGPRCKYPLVDKPGKKCAFDCTRTPENEKTCPPANKGKCCDATTKTIRQGKQAPGSIKCTDSATASGPAETKWPAWLEEVNYDVCSMSDHEDACMALWHPPEPATSGEDQKNTKQKPAIDAKTKAAAEQAALDRLTNDLEDRTGRCFWCASGACGENAAEHDERLLVLGPVPTESEPGLNKNQRIELMDAMTTHAIATVVSNGKVTQSRGSWAVCDETSFISVHTGKRKFFGGLVCHVQGMTRACFQYFARMRVFTEVGYKEFVATNNKFTKANTVVVGHDPLLRNAAGRLMLYLFDRSIAARVYSKHAAHGSEWVLDKPCNQAPDGATGSSDDIVKEAGGTGELSSTSKTPGDKKSVSGKKDKQGLNPKSV